jgi:hypothetical protein
LCARKVTCSWQPHSTQLSLQRCFTCGSGGVEHHKAYPAVSGQIYRMPGCFLLPRPGTSEKCPRSHDDDLASFSNKFRHARWHPHMRTHSLPEDKNTKQRTHPNIIRAQPYSLPSSLCYELDCDQENFCPRCGPVPPSRLLDSCKMPRRDAIERPTTPTSTRHVRRSRARTGAQATSRRQLQVGTPD